MTWSLKIYDIGLSNGESFYNVPFNLSVAEIEKQIEQLDYNFGVPYDERYDTLRLPLMSAPWADFIVKNNRIPGELEFYHYYIWFYQGTYNTLTDDLSVVREKTVKYLRGIGDENPDQDIAIKLRLHKAYPSLIRDIHFFLMCLDSEVFDDVQYSIRYDALHNTDVLLGVKDEKGEFHKIEVALFVDSDRGYEWFQTKEVSESQYAIPVQLNEEACKKVGKFYLLKWEHLLGLCKAISLNMFDPAFLKRTEEKLIVDKISRQ